MNSTVFLKATFLLLLFSSSIRVHSQATDFNIKKYGAKGDGKSNDSPAIKKAWFDACGSRDPSKLVIPGGKYMVGPITLQGPCKAPIKIDVQGTLLAPKDPHRMASQDGWIVFQTITGLTLTGGTYDGQGAFSWTKTQCAKSGKCNLVTSLRFNSLTNSTVANIKSLNSKFNHMNVMGCKNLTIKNITISAPGNSPNTDGIHIGRSNGVNISYANIQTGDDCISIGDGTQQLDIEKVTCGPGHGLSIGSLGKYHDEEPVVGIRVKNCTLTKTMWGARVKTWPASPSGVASDIHFDDVIMNDVSLPILIDQEYCPYGQCHNKVPSRVKISNVSFKNIRGTSTTKLVAKLVCSKGIPCTNVQMEDIHLEYHGNDGPATSQCANVKPILSGDLSPSPCATTSSHPSQ